MLARRRTFRGHYTRNYLAAYLETQALSDAATQIQAKFRAHAVRRRLNRWESMASTVQSAFRGPSRTPSFASRSVRAPVSTRACLNSRRTNAKNAKNGAHS